MALNKNEASRLRKVSKSLDIVLDQLHTANGVLYPASLASYAKRVQTLAKGAADLKETIDEILPATRASEDLAEAAE